MVFYQKKWTLDFRKTKTSILVLNLSPFSTIFHIVRFPGDQKFVLIYAKGTLKSGILTKKGGL